MASRYSSYKVLDFCFNPRRIFRDGEFIQVPCGKCEGCHLHRVNMLSQRLSFEIDNNPYSIFTTLTYNNKYLPTLKRQSEVLLNSYLYYSDHIGNIRFNGVNDVMREDHILFSHGDYRIKIENDSRNDVNYASKRDLQLWLKLLRQDLINYFPTDDKSKFFRYYFISEQGPTTLRAHFHGIIFPRSKEVAEVLLSESMYKNWQMCDEVLFRQYTKYCDSGTSTYVTNYVTSVSKLPAIYQGSPIEPFRISSKSPAIGYAPFDASKVFEDVTFGSIEYNRTIKRIEQSSVLSYPSDYMVRLFPKCYQFASLSYSRLLFVYGYLYRSVIGAKRPDFLVSARLRKELHVGDYEATKTCYEWCKRLGCTPFHYLYVLDLYYYKRAMLSLRKWYQWQEANSDKKYLLLRSYVNVSDYVFKKDFLSDYQKFMLREWFEGFAVDFDSLSAGDGNLFVYIPNDQYVADTMDIYNGLNKMSKFNELSGNSPHIV